MTSHFISEVVPALFSLLSDKMVTRRLRSECMKKYKDPQWESYAKCYEELLKYRLTRRLLEQTHEPWSWSGSDTDSEAGEGGQVLLRQVEHPFALYGSGERDADAAGRKTHNVRPAASTRHIHQAALGGGGLR